MNDLAFLGSELPETWAEGHIADVTSKVGSGATPRGGSAVYVETGTSFIRSQNVYDHEFRRDGLAHIADEAAEQLRGVRVQPRDVLLNITGDSILRTCLVPRSALPARVSQHVAIIRTNGRVDPGFLQKWLSLPAMKYFMLGHSSGGTRKAITKCHILSFPIPLPPVTEQRGIAATLGVLDDKIESNHRARDLIKGLLLAAFEELLAKNKFEEVPLAGIATSTKGVSYKSVDLLPSRTSLVTLKSIDRSGGYKSNGLKQYVGPYKPQQVTIPGDIVVAQTDLTQGAEVVGRAVRVPPENSAATLVASLDLVIVRPNPDIPTEYLLGVLTDERFRAHCCSRTSGTTVLHLASDAIPTYMAPLVGTDVREDFASRAGPLVERGDGLASETRSLIALRDTLLPELLSGRIRVSEARGVVEEAVG